MSKAENQSVAELVVMAPQTGEAWVEMALPTIMAVVRERSGIEDRIKAETEGFNLMIAEVRAGYKPELDRLEKVEGALRERVLKEYDGTDALRCDTGEVTFPLRWDFKVVDAAKVGKKYLAIDTKLIRADIKDGIRKIAGIVVEQVRTLTVRPKKD